MKLRLPNKLIAAILAAATGIVCTTVASASTAADWNISLTDNGNKLVYQLAADGAYDLNLGPAAVTNSTYSRGDAFLLTVETTKTDGWTLASENRGTIIASTSTGSGNVDGDGAFTARMQAGTTPGAVIYVNGWNYPYGSGVLRGTYDSEQPLTTLGFNFEFTGTNASTDQFTFSSSSNSDMSFESKTDSNVVRNYTFSKLSNMGAGLDDYSSVSSVITMTKAAVDTVTFSGATLQGLTIGAGVNVAFSGTNSMTKGIENSGTLSLAGTVTMNSVSSLEIVSELTENGFGGMTRRFVKNVGDGTVSVADGFTITGAATSGYTIITDENGVLLQASDTTYTLVKDETFRTRSDSADSKLHNATNINIESGATLLLDTEVNGGNGVLRQNVTVRDGGTLKMTAGDTLGWSNGADAVRTLTIEKGGVVNLAHSTNESVSATINLHGLMTGNNGSMLDFLNNASLNVAAGESGTIEHVQLRLRKDNTTFTVGEGGILTINSNVVKSDGGNNNLYLKGSGTTHLNGSVGASNSHINLYVDNSSGSNGVVTLGGTGYYDNINVSRGQNLTLQSGANVTTTGTGSRISGTMTVEQGATLTTGDGVTFEVSDDNGQAGTLAITGGNVTVNKALRIGRVGNGGGNVTMSSGSLTVGSVGTEWGGSFNMSGGTLEFTSGNETTSSITRTNSAANGVDVTLNGSSLVLKATNSWMIDKVFGNKAFNIGSFTVDAANTGNIILKNATWQNGTITNNSNLTLNNLTATGSNVSIDGTGTTLLQGGSFRANNEAIRKLGTGTLNISGNLSAENSGLTMYNGNVVFSSGNVALSRIMATNTDGGTGNTAINIGTDESNATVTVGRIELGDAPSSNYTSSLTVNEGSTLIVTGADNGNNYKTASLLFGEWSQKTTAHVAGELLAKNALLLGGDNGFDLTINGGTVAVVGVGQSHSDRDPQESLQITNNGKLILGAKGIDSTGTGGNASTGLSVSIADGTIGLSAANVTINRPVSITGNATFDTDLYAFNDAGTAIAKPEGEQTSGTFNISGGLSIGDAGMVTVAGDGSVNLSGSVNVHNTVDTSIAQFSEGTYGYLSSINVKFVDDDSIAKVVANDVSWSVGGMTAAQLGFTGATYADGAVSMTSLAQDAPKRWFMNTGEGGTFTYTGAAEQEMTSIIINAKQDAQGNIPVLHLNTTGAPTTLTNIIVNNTTANIELASGAVLNSSSLMTNLGGQAVLTGAGTFNLGAMSMGGSSAVNLTLPTGVSVGAADAWTGVVSVGGTIQWLNAASLSSLANANSWVEFKGVSGYFNSSQTVAANIRFTDNGGEAAFKTTGVFSNSTLTYNGKISGSGTYYLNGASGGQQTFKFNGDASAWAGTLKSNNTGAGNQIDIANKFGATLLNEGGTMTVNFNSGAICAGAVQNSGTTLTANFNSGSAFTGALQSNAGTLKAYNNTGDTLSLRTIGLQGGNVELYSGRFSIDKNDNTYGLFTDAEGNAGTLTINSGASLSLAAQHKFYQFQLGKAGTGVIVKNGGSFELNSYGGTQYTVSALSSAADASVKRTENSTGQINYTIGKTDVRIENAKLDISVIQQNTAFANELKNTSVVNNAADALTVSNSANTLVGVDAQGGAILVQNAANSAATLKTIKAVGGDVTIQSLGADATVNLNELTIAGSKTVSAYTGTPTAEQIAAAQNGSNTAVEATLAISNGTLSAGSGAKLNAHLTLGNNTTLNIADATVGGAGLTMGSTVTFEQGAKMHLSDDIINGLNGLITSQAFNTGLTLFSGVDSFFLGTDEYDSSKTYAATDYFDLSGVQRPWDFVIKYDDVARSQSGGVVYLWMETPEPATATLSLLALAALAARRRRH